MSNPRSLRARRGILALAVSLALAVAASGSDASPKTFDVPEGSATAALKAFTQQSGVEVLFPTDAVARVRTNAVRGEMTARQALEAMVQGTGFAVVQDEKTGALGLRASDEAAAAGTRTTPASEIVKMSEVRVLGSRIRRSEAEGPSPVNSYDRDYIRATGAFTTADLLNQLPQTYSGISVGRGSTPNELNPEFGQRTETTTPAFNFVLGSSAASPAQTGVSGVSLRGLGTGNTLVLVDGRRVAQSGAGNRGMDTRQGFVDLNTIPMGMIDRVEVITDGASAIYGSDAVAGVINLILKKDYTGTEVNAGLRVAEHGGGQERTGSVLHGFNFGRLSGTVSLEYFSRQNLKASERSFSKNQNHTLIPVGTLLSTGATQYGRDFRLNYGYPAVIQASGGLVSGTFDAIPGVRVVLVPEGSTATPTIAQFVPVTTPAGTATVVNAAGQRRANTASYMDLIGESSRTGASASLNYRITDTLEAYTTLRTSKNFSYTTAQVGGNSITGGFGTAALLPAALNPFNQNVTVGMILPEWGAESQRVKTLADSVTAGLHGHWGKTWQYDLGGNWEKQKARSSTRSFRSAGFSALLTNADATQRFNPFIDARAAGAPSQAALLETLANYTVVRSSSELSGVDFSADGDLFDFWGGPVKMAFGGESGEVKAESISATPSNALVPVVTTATTGASQRSHGIYAEFLVPLVGKANARELTRRLDLQLAGRYDKVGSFQKSVPTVGIAWAPLQSVLVRGSWKQNFRAPGVTEYMVAPSTITSTLTDPRRTPPSTTGVVVTRGSNPNPQSETSDSSYAGIVVEPPFVKGLTLKVDYYETEQTDVLQLLSAQTIINNESLFTDRITRAAADATDLSLNQPGRITAVNTIFVNFGRVVNKSVDFTAEYRLPWETFGRWRVSVAGSQTIEATRQLAPGQPPVILDDDTSAPPKWRFNSALFWRKGGWGASAYLWYLSSFVSNSAGNALVANNTAVRYYATPAVTKLDLRASYEFQDGIWRGYGKNMRVGVGVSNVFDKKPPFSDTVWGFNAGLHSQLMLGRAYEFSLLLPF